MNILMIGPAENNSTDGIIIRGIHNLLTHSYGPYTYTYKTLKDIQPMTANDFYPTKSFDLIVICGTPWLWDMFQNSPKYKNLLLALNTHPKSKRLFMGIGTCLNLEDAKSNILERPDEVKGIIDLLSNSTIIVRDNLAYAKLNKAGLTNYYFPCPAYYSYGVDFQKSTTFNKNVLVWIDPTKSISSVSWKSKEKLDAFCRTTLAFYRKYKPEVYCANDDDIALAEFIGLPTPKVLRTADDTLNLMKDANYVLSGRVHCAVPAFIQGKALGLMPLDTRGMVLSDFDGLTVQNPTDIDKLTHKAFDFDQWLMKYDYVLRKV